MLDIAEADASRPLNHAPLPMRTSQVLAELTKNVWRRELSVAWLLQRLRMRVYGLGLLLFALPSCLPMPPGVPTVCGLLLSLIAGQMILGLAQPRLPRVLARRRLATTDIERLVGWAVPWIERMERLARPRWPLITGTWGQRAIGSVVLVLALIIILPLPLLGNMPPAFAIAVIAVGLTERDGVIVTLGILVSVVALALSGALAIEAAQWLIHWARQQ